MERGDPFRARTFARDRRTWILTFLFGAALWAGTTAWLNRHILLAPRLPAGPGDDGRFAVLAFDRVLAEPEPRHLGRIAIRDRLRGLARAGFSAVTLREVKDACDGRIALPAKPILITFDEGYLSTYEAVDPVLRELHWPAVMFLRTERQETRDVAYLFWDRLARMVESGLWEVASGDPSEAPPPAVASPVPDAPPGSRRIGQRLSAPQVFAWAPRGWDPVAALSCALDARARRTAGRPAQWLGFTDDPAGVNRAGADPYRLARLRVDPAWSTEELVGRLARSLSAVPLHDPNDAGALPAAPWVPGEGAVETTAAGIALTGTPRAEIWIPGALFAPEFVVEATLTPGSGEYWLMQEGDAPGSEWRVGGEGARVYVEVRRPGEPPEVLARRDLAKGARGPRRVRILRRGAGLVVWWDGTPLAETPLALPKRPWGKLGAITYGGSAEGHLVVSDLRFAAIPFAVRSVAASPSAEEIARLAREAPTIAALAPSWGTLAAGTLRVRSLDDELFRILARRYAWEILPNVDVLDAGVPGGRDGAWAKETAARLTTDGFSGARFDFGAQGAETRKRWTPALKELDLALARAGGRLVVAGARTR